jgi:hypothetical protein
MIAVKALHFDVKEISMEFNEVVDIINDINPDALFADGLNGAILGYAERCNMNTVVVYDVEKILEILMNDNGWTFDEALEYYEQNILGAYLGENTPIYVNRLI